MEESRGRTGRRLVVAGAGLALLLVACCAAATIVPVNRGGEGDESGRASLEQESLFVYGLGGSVKAGSVKKALSQFEQAFSTFMHGHGEAKLKEGLSKDVLEAQEGGMSLPQLSVTGRGHSGGFFSGNEGDLGLRMLLGNAGKKVQEKYGSETAQKDKVLDSLRNVENLLLRPESQQNVRDKMLREIDEKEKVNLLFWCVLTYGCVKSGVHILQTSCCHNKWERAEEHGSLLFFLILLPAFLGPL